LIVLLSAASADAKGRTVKIALVDPSAQSRPIEMTGTAVAAFYVWAGAGVRINGAPETEGFIGDWKKGTVDKRPEGLRRFRVSFYAGCLRDELFCSTPESKLSYVVMYEYDAAVNAGYVYLPGRGEDGYELNTSSILRGVEGKWFPATAEWRDYIAPVIGRAQSASH
jgi:hypothetical protein